MGGGRAIPAGFAPNPFQASDLQSSDTVQEGSADEQKDPFAPGHHAHSARSRPSRRAGAHEPFSTGRVQEIDAPSNLREVAITSASRRMRRRTMMPMRRS